MINRSRRSQSLGFTLIEVLVTIVLMAIVLPVAMRGINISLNAAGTARRSADAAQLAEQKMNELISLQDATQLDGSGDFGAEWPIYSWTSTSQTSDQGVISVTLDVNYLQAGSQRQVELSTMLSQDALSQSASSGSSPSGSTP